MSVTFLEHPSKAHPTLLPVCLATALVLMIANLFIYQILWLWIAAVLVLLAAYAVWLELEIKEIWPLIALCVATVVVGITATFQNASFGGVLTEVHAMNQMPFGQPYKARMAETESYFSRRASSIW